MAPTSSIVILVLLLITDITNTATWYGHLRLTDDKKALNDRWGHSSWGKQFKRKDIHKDEWQRSGDKNDKKTYIHLDGAFFSTGGLRDWFTAGRKQRWFARQKNSDESWAWLLEKRFDEITDIINDKGRKSAFDKKDLVNYNLYLYTGNTHNYGLNNQKPELYVEMQDVFSCYMVAMNNLMQYPVFTKNTEDKRHRLIKGTMQKELDRQWEIEKAKIPPQQHHLIEPEFVMERNIHTQALKGSNVGPVKAALKYHFNIDLELIQDHTLYEYDEISNPKISAETLKLPRNRYSDDYLLNNGIIGYLVNLHMGNWYHWVAVKYFNGDGDQSKGWYVWCGSRLHRMGKVNGLIGPEETFDEAYKKIYDYWKDERGNAIDSNRLYECKKSSKGADDKSQKSSDYHGPYNYYDIWFILPLIVLPLFIGACCIGLGFGFMVHYYYSKYSKKEIGRKQWRV